MASHSDSFKIVTFYTPDYEPGFQRLSLTAQKHGLDIIGRPVKDMSWREAIDYKPLFIRDMFKEYGRILWVDSDAVIRSEPELIKSLNCDIACHFRNDKRYTNELLSGTLFFGGRNSLKLLDLWCDEQKKGGWDQRNLAHVIARNEGFSIFKLPASYTLIFDTMADRGPAVIEHFQYSRKKKDNDARAMHMIGEGM